ncbi:MAG: MFS transporter [Deltaproteobacteria bacterium HGW-Deltaproteobacteria-15]|jgi:MFS family permease|nr:MAG: MFS transporter [Deltaproteobacteria bacterium HGW-Deltaproteobacteria-15]
MTYAAAIPLLQQEWGMSAVRAGTISSGFQLGYALSLFVMSTLADKFGPRVLYMWSMFAGALLSVAFAAFARGYTSALVIYFLLAMALAGSYTTGLMILAARYPSNRRGKATGYFIASSSMGFVLSLALSGWTLPMGGYRLSFAAASACCILGWLFSVLFLRKVRLSPVVRHERQTLKTEVLSNKPVLMLMAAYTFHCWELLGMWAWTPAFLAAYLQLKGLDGLSAAGFGSYVTAAFHGAGLFASLIMGGLSDRLGRAYVIMVASGISTLCSFVFGWSMVLPFAAVFSIGFAYTFFSLSDSPVLSAALTEVTSASFLGRAFGLRSLLGFGAGAVSPVVFGAVLDWVNPLHSGELQYAAWGWAFTSLGLPGLATFWIAARLRALHHENNKRSQL